MWQTRKETESGGRVLKLGFDDGATALRYADVIRLWREKPDFRSFFAAQLAAAPFDAFRWETPAVNVASVNQPFECVILNSPGLAKSPDVDAFASYFASSGKDGVAVFPNLGGDATLIVPCPVAPISAYGHLASFLRRAPAHQIDALWQCVGDTMAEKIGKAPIWLSTAGAGVAWLHVRIDSRPKYYGYAPYKEPPAT